MNPFYFLDGNSHGRKHGIIKLKEFFMALSDDVKKASDLLDTFVEKEAANIAEIASLKQQVDSLTADRLAATEALAKSQADLLAANSATSQAAADAAAVQPLLDKISALSPAPVAGA